MRFPVSLEVDTGNTLPQCQTLDDFFWWLFKSNSPLYWDCYTTLGWFTDKVLWNCTSPVLFVLEQWKCQSKSLHWQLLWGGQFYHQKCWGLISVLLSKLRVVILFNANLREIWRECLLGEATAFFEFACLCLCRGLWRSKVLPCTSLLWFTVWLKGAHPDVNLIKFALWLKK